MPPIKRAKAPKIAPKSPLAAADSKDEARGLKSQYLIATQRYAAQVLPQIKAKIEDSITKETNINMLILSKTEMKANDFVAIHITFRIYQHLQAICLWEITLKPGAINMLCELLYKQPTITHLEIVSSELVPQDISTLASHLKIESSLKYINLDHNQLMQSSVLIFSAFEGPRSKLGKLSMRYCSITSNCSESIARLIENCPTLTNLDLHGNNIGDAGLYAIAGPLSRTKNLESFSLAFNQIGGSIVDGRNSFSLLCSAVAANNLWVLDLSGNFFGNHGMQHIVELMKTRKNNSLPINVVGTGTRRLI